MSYYTPTRRDRGVVRAPTGVAGRASNPLANPLANRPVPGLINSMPGLYRLSYRETVGGAGSGGQAQPDGLHKYVQQPAVGTEPDPPEYVYPETNWAVQGCGSCGEYVAMGDSSVSVSLSGWAMLALIGGALYLWVQHGHPKR